MEHLHDRIYLKANQAVEVSIDLAANVMLMTDANYSRYRREEKCQGVGGNYKYSPAVVKPANPGYYNLVIDLGGGSGSLRLSYSIIDC